MKKEFWLEKWKSNQTGFHKASTHPLLIKYIDKLGLKKGDTVLVPLCGKTIDMLWLSNEGYRVIGVELSQIAVEQFFTENKLSFEHSKNDFFTVYSHQNITIYQGDYFDLSAEDTKDVKAVYDRAALIALPDGLNDKYIDHMNQALPVSTSMLLITLEMNRTKVDALGPPFSIPDIKVSELFKNYTSIELLQEVNIITREKKFKEQGCDFVYERVYLIHK